MGESLKAETLLGGPRAAAGGRAALLRAVQGVVCLQWQAPHQP